MAEAGNRVLVVEDDRATAELERRALQRMGCSVVIATTLEEATLQLADLSWSAVVLDFNLGAVPAWPVLDICKQATHALPVIMVTAMGDERLASEAISRGASDYVIKTGNFMHRLTQSVESAIRITRAERSLQQMKDWQSAILGSVDAHIALLDGEATIMLVNDAWARFAEANGYCEPEFGVGQNYLTVLEQARGTDREYAQRAEKGLHEVLSGQSLRFSMEYPCHSPTEQRWYRLDVSPVREQQQLGAVVMHVDITERVLEEEARRENAELLQNILQTVDEGILVVSAEGLLVQWNRAAENILGVTAGDLFSDWRAQLTPDRSAMAVNTTVGDFPLVRALEGKVVTDEELFIAPPGGRHVYVSVNARPLPDKMGQVRGAVATFRDISDRVARDIEIRRIAAAVEQTADAIIITDRSYRIEYVNPAFERLYGYSAEESRGKNISMLCGDSTTPERIAEIELILDSGKSWSGRLANQTKDGVPCIVDNTITPVYDNLGQVCFYVASERDVTAQVEMEAQFRQSQKMEAIGVLAGGIAHDFNNILAAIVGYTQMACSNLKENPQATSDLEYVLRAADRARELVRQILTFSRQAEIKIKPIEYGDILKESVDLMRATLPSNITIQFQSEMKEAVVLADATQMQQVIVNLCTNAAQSMRENGGRLTIHLDRTLIHDSGNDASDLQLPNGNYACMSVRDTGYGIPPEIMSKIFDPFFSTKKERGGTGLGLSTVLGIVQEHEGSITVKSTVGEGTEFQVYLPLTEALTPAPAQSQPGRIQRGAGEHILIVDDEQSLAMLSGRLLENLGYKVSVHINPNDALDAFRAASNSFDLILSDLSMPEMTGDKLARGIHEICPNIPVVLLSGFTDDHEFSGTDIFSVLLKPVHLAHLAATIHDGLASRTRVDSA